MKKKIIMSMLALAVFLGGVQVYAVTALDSNIIGLITAGINSIKT
jgi:hypothetical protein